MLHFPFLKLMDRLQNDSYADFAIGVDSYVELLDAISGGFGVENPEALRRTCSLLFVNSNLQQESFDLHFDICLEWAKELERVVALEEAETKGDVVEQKKYDHEKKDQEQTKLDKPEPSEKVEKASENEEAQSGREQVQRGSYKASPEEQGLIELELLSNVKPSMVVVGNYEPASKRDFDQTLRTVRDRYEKVGQLDEIDIDKTIARLTSQGFLETPVYKAKLVNTSALVLMIDVGGSMLPFERYAGRLLGATQHLSEVQTYYFRNAPGKVLFREPELLSPIKVTDALAQLSSRSKVLVFSDGGAARGTESLERLEKTRTFFDLLYGHVEDVVWLNPMPVHRWRNTTAEHIARQLAPMFRMNTSSLRTAINTLQGK